MLHLIWYVIVGFLAGCVAKALLHTHLSITWTIVLGIVGSIIGGAVTHLFSPPSGGGRHRGGKAPVMTDIEQAVFDFEQVERDQDLWSAKWKELHWSAMPPEATNGIFSSSAARGNRIMLGMSSSPGWPPHSKPSTLTASQPMRSAFSGPPSFAASSTIARIA